MTGGVGGVNRQRSDGLLPRSQIVGKSPIVICDAAASGL